MMSCGIHVCPCDMQHFENDSTFIGKILSIKLYALLQNVLLDMEEMESIVRNVQKIT